VGSLVDPVVVAGRTAPSRVVFGAHVTNLGAGRAIGPRHIAYYRERAAGGAGVVVTETASVHPSDWPYERAPLASACAPGWGAVADACRPFGTLVLASLGHSGAQGSSAYGQEALWAPSPVADAVSRELPRAMEDEDVVTLVAGFAEAAGLAVRAGLAGVEVDIGPRSLLRQFHSGLTNHRDDAYGSDRLRLTREVLAAVRAEVGPGGVLAARLCADELAPWAGVTPDQGRDHVVALAPLLDLVTVVRGGPFSTSAERPDAHTPPVFNRALCADLRGAIAGTALVVLQGSVVDPADAQAAIDDGTADLVEMTRAQIADPRLVRLVRAGTPERVRPCIRCNQACQVRDPRNPLVSCVGEPRSGYETTEPPVEQPAELPVAPLPTGPSPERSTTAGRPTVVVVGGGVAGLECARVLAGLGLGVRVLERAATVGGMAARVAVGPGRTPLDALTAWLEAECRVLGVAIETGVDVVPADLDRALAAGEPVVLATGSRPGPLPFSTDERAVVLDAPTALADSPASLPAGPVVVHDPVGGPVGIAMAELLAAEGRTVSLVTPDPVAGTLLAVTGDLADANARLQRAGVRRELRARLREVLPGAALVEHVWTGERHQVPCAVVVDCGPRLPEETLAAARPDLPRAGDCVAPRTVLEAILEGRRRALEVAARVAAARPVPARPFGREVLQP
jgi:mycofactocin system FadH/OYE family oxidoreductase 1